MSGVMYVPGPDAVLDQHFGDVFLREQRNQTKVYCVKASNPLPWAAAPTTAFDKNPWFVKAKRQHKPWAALVTPSNNVLLVPTKPYASIKDFAERCTMDEWRRMWVSIMDVRCKLQVNYNTLFYISTIGFHVPQLHIRLVPEKRQSSIDPKWTFECL
jgi:hypothetical protein